MRSAEEFVEFLKSFKSENIKFKPYDNEKAVISFTSWRKRINTAHYTLESLIEKCKGFHIVLVLSSEEFPLKEKEIPENILKLHDYFELLWVEKNYKAFKKVLFTMDKYRDVPVISADDDCVYKINYAEELYKRWTAHKNSFVTYMSKRQYDTWGFATLFPPFIFKDYGLKMIENMYDEIKSDKIFCDDGLYGFIRKKMNLMYIVRLNSMKICDFVSVDNESSLGKLRSIKKGKEYSEQTIKLYEKVWNRVGGK